MPFFLHLPGTDVLYPVTVALKAKFSVKRRLRMLVRESGLGLVRGFGLASLATWAKSDCKASCCGHGTGRSRPYKTLEEDVVEAAACP